MDKKPNTNTTDNFRIARICGMPLWPYPSNTPNGFLFYPELDGWPLTCTIGFACVWEKEANQLIGAINTASVIRAYLELHEGGVGKIVYVVKNGASDEPTVEANVEFEQLDLFPAPCPKEKSLPEVPPGTPSIRPERPGREQDNQDERELED
jgi:hypothetical protein